MPQPLLDQYVSMTDPARAQTVDTDIAKHCAYSLPGVALTLGRQNWHCLKDTYETLASDVQWKVRQTLAFSIHELAVILGDQFTAANLLPISNGFLKDLDEVRIGVLKHLYDFLKLPCLRVAEDAFYRTTDSQHFDDKQWKKWISQRVFMALYVASHRGRSEAVQYLLEHGANCQGRSPVGRTPLHVAAAMSRLDCISLQLNYGASVNDRDTKGETPMSLACHLSHRQSRWQTFLFYWMVKLGTKDPMDPVVNKAFQRVKAGFGSKKENKT
ncbi:ankyrin repeat domain-containing protein 60 [Neophocaena asiaeorientalis asiaeorientalis]|uniref:Ankyrin repeat domain-containing protein 60 n=1 Tax=Neophocaena asiaeorientalis asiaeorientalis TaxID=1706337 RepID=A0A341BWA1_NEOAA|nr:ankyrin repeat domain-containing protein 60 [Neophocaena asiaeorientalis asiaeorientalis]